MSEDYKLTIMKELTIEEKAKAYDEAIKKAESLYKAAEPMSGCNVILETIFPELKESEDEDEKIKGAAIEFVRQNKSFNYCLGISKEEVVAWLEKQGEQKSADKVEPMSLDEAIEHCKEKSCGNNACALEHKQLEKWLTELKELKEQKPAWSEEDEELMKWSINNLTELKDRFGEEYGKVGDCINWLESLRPQKQWKPSDEQIKVCKEVYADILSAKGFNLGTVNSELNRLEEELKKLREE